ncbi:MAG TPA: NapC/NirT family cytochrome c [Candidatus Methylacidiphilales bacterium]|jgi:nitrate/TMAO reductase-like tetraheme cytochrome c subunit|nr:NapC/NirT family cytochrome c [Candidatus Methylacidiphilales bacterium]
MPPEEHSRLPWLPKVLHNWISLAGGVLATGSVFAFVLLTATEILGNHANSYIGLLVYGVAPVFFIIGLLLVLAGFWSQRYQKVAQPLQIDLTRSRDRKLLVVFALCTVAFLLATAFGSYQTFEYTESVEFCGAACHLPMHPEYTTYLQSPHARVGCVECHVGAGAEWYVRSKVNGLHQLYDVVTNQIPKPIPTPVHNMRPARATCEQCHWPERFIGNIDRTFQHYLSDDTNTPFAVRLLLKVGGGGADGPPRGIHWHVSRGEKVEFIATDAQRQVIPWVRVTDLASGKVTVYKDAGFHDDPSKYQLRTMDCIDCHSRPAHQFTAPNEAVDQAITVGQLDHAVPKLKHNVVAVLTASYQTTDEALEKIASGLRADYPNQAGIGQIVSTAQQIYRDNFFPEMKTDWRVHPDNIGHKDWPGCFRCHDGNHKTEDGTQTIAASNCNECHIILAQGSGDQLKQLKADGYDFFHIDSPYSDFNCTMCHTGGPQK